MNRQANRVSQSRTDMIVTFTIKVNLLPNSLCMVTNFYLDQVCQKNIIQDCYNGYFDTLVI